MYVCSRRGVCGEKRGCFSDTVKILKSMKNETPTSGTLWQTSESISATESFGTGIFTMTCNVT